MRVYVTYGDRKYGRKEKKLLVIGLWKNLVRRIKMGGGNGVDQCPCGSRVGQFSRLNINGEIFSRWTKRT